MVKVGKPGLIKLTPEQFARIKGYLIDRGDIAALYLYGSYGSNHQGYFSDVDFAILPYPGIYFKLEEEMIMQSNLCRIGGSDDISLINLAKASPVMRMKILETGKLLFYRDKIVLADFIEATMKYYCDLEPFIKSLYRDYDIGLRKDYL